MEEKQSFDGICSISKEDIFTQANFDIEGKTAASNVAIVPVSSDHCVITGLKNGIGNILVEMLVGLIVAKELTEATGNTYEYYGYLSDAVMRGHKTEYNGEHQIAKIPLEIYKIFPYVSITDNIPEDATHVHYVKNTDISMENLKLTSKIFIDVDCIDNVVEKIITDDFRKNIMKPLTFNPNIKHYINKKYFSKSSGILQKNTNVGIHVRLYQPGDYVITRYPSIGWYVRAIKQLFNSEELVLCYSNTAFKIRKTVTVFVVSGVDSATIKNTFFNELQMAISAEIGNIPGVNVVLVQNEPYCVDMCLLSMCDHLIISNSTLSMGAALYPNVRSTTYPHHMSDTVYRGIPLKFPGFVELRDENFGDEQFVVHV